MFLFRYATLFAVLSAQRGREEDVDGDYDANSDLDQETMDAFAAMINQLENPFQNDVGLETPTYEEEPEEDGILNYNDNTEGGEEEQGIEERKQSSFFSLSQFAPDAAVDEVADEVVDAIENQGSDRSMGYAPTVEEEETFNGLSSIDVKAPGDRVNACFTCDAVGSDAATLIASCQSTGFLVECEADSKCLIEIRKRNGKFTSMRTLCKSRVACDDQHKQNFGPGPLLRQQCRPEDNLTSRRFGPSVCRQCFDTCTGDSSTNAGTMCFSPSAGIPTLSSGLTHFNVLAPSSPCTTSSCSEFGRSWWDAGLSQCQNQATLTAVTDCSNTAYEPTYTGYQTGTVHKN